MSIVDYISSLDYPKCCMTYDYFNTTRVKFEDLIPGYRTNSVTGRDSLSTEVTESTNKFKDGTDLEKSRHQTRDITVTSTLVSETVEDHRKNLDLLKGYLHQRDPYGEMAIVFDDEPDVFYEGLISSITETPLAVDGNASTVVITIHCSKPYKYSLAIYECVNHAVDLTDSETRQIITVEYGGTAKVHPEIVIRPTLEYGFVGLANQYGNVLQLGDPDEVDKDYNFSKTKVMTNPKFNPTYSGKAITGTDTNAKVFSNSGIKNAAKGDRYLNTDTDNVYSCTLGGNASKAKWKYDGKKSTVITIPSEWAKNTNQNTLFQTSQNYPLEIPNAAAFEVVTKSGLTGIAPTTPGTGNAWHGPSRMYTVPNTGTDRNVNGVLGWYHYFAMQTDVAVGNLGCQQFAMLDENKHIIAAVDYRKNKSYNKDAFVQMFIKNKKVETIQYEPIRYNTISGRVGNSYGNSHIYKFGKLIIFDINGKKYQFTEPSIQNTTICYLVVYAGASGTYSQMDSVIGALKYSRNASANLNIKNVPNKIQPEHNYVLDCETGMITVDGAERPDLGALGNDWEEFYLEPGTNQFECLCSDWYSIGSQSNYKSSVEPVVDPVTGEITYTDDNGNTSDTRFPRYAMYYREVFI